MSNPILEGSEKLKERKKKMYSGVIINSIIRTVVSEMTRDSYEFVKKQMCSLASRKEKRKAVDVITGV